MEIGSINPTQDTFDKITSISLRTSSYNPVPSSIYTKPHKNLTFSYVNSNAKSFQIGKLGENDTYLIGSLRLDYPQLRQIRNVILQLKGIEKTCWFKPQARSKSANSAEQVLIEKAFRIFSADDGQEMQSSDLPFKVKLPHNLPESITTDIGSIKYFLRATVNRKGVIGNANIVEVECELKKTIILDIERDPPYQLRGESRNGLEYAFILPPFKHFKIGSFVSIPMRIRFLRPNIHVDRVQVSLVKFMDFRCTNPNEARHIKQEVASLTIAREELRSIQKTNLDCECVHTINLFIPRATLPTISTRYISNSYQLSIKLCLVDEIDLQIDEIVRLASILETNNRTSTSESQQILSRQVFDTFDQQKASRLQHQTSISTFGTLSITSNDGEPMTPPNEPSSQSAPSQKLSIKALRRISSDEYFTSSPYPTALSPPPYHKPTSPAASHLIERSGIFQ
ncbi:2302_t:CDS:2 [Ambispora gerdemannii]|uniref:2302_t:CDS:1 n=1 Tax=Ambispora gerdemannii TaxID=144530 RepID=A0A9N9AJ78_9GLOM|nr:2302_t:CDS:2 [Ambispora gerdemannii]